MLQILNLFFNPITLISIAIFSSFFLVSTPIFCCCCLIVHFFSNLTCFLLALPATHCTNCLPQCLCSSETWLPSNPNLALEDSQIYQQAAFLSSTKYLCSDSPRNRSGKIFSYVYIRGHQTRRDIISSSFLQVNRQLFFFSLSSNPELDLGYGMSSPTTDKNKDFCSAGDAFPQCEDNLEHGELSNRLHWTSVITSFLFAAVQGACKTDLDHGLSLSKPANYLTAQG